MTSIISVLDLRTSSLRMTLCIFFSFCNAILVDPQIEYGARSRLLAAKRATKHDENV